MYKAQLLKKEFYNIFAGVYNDFRLNSFRDYKFELEPLEYNEFITYFEKGTLGCVVLTESDIPTGFLVYTTVPDEAIELNIIHCLGDENLNEKRKVLLEKFLEVVTTYRTSKVISYPMLGKSAEFSRDITRFGFGTIDLSVTAFNLTNPQAAKALKETKVNRFPIGYKMMTYKDFMFNDLVMVINEAFKNSNDVKYDPRFATLAGSKDILNKIVNEIYGQFLPQASKILLFENKPVGLCFANITAGTIGNIPLVAILQEHQGKGLSNILLKATVEDLIRGNKLGVIRLREVNASVEKTNIAAVRMYEKCGFRELYSYPQAYAPKIARVE